MQSATFDFGDGNAPRTVQGLATTHSYGASGTFTATVTVRFANGRTASNAAAVRVN